MSHSTFKLVFIEVTLSMGYQYPRGICTFLGYVEAFSCHKADIFTMTKKLLGNMFPTLDILSKCSLKAIYITPPYAKGW